MTYRSSILVLALMAFAVPPAMAQGLKERSTLGDRTDRSMKATNPARETTTKGTGCSCPRPGASGHSVRSVRRRHDVHGQQPRPVRNACCRTAPFRAAPRSSMPHRLADFLGHLLGVAEQHHGVVAVEQRVVDARVSRRQ